MKNMQIAKRLWFGFGLTLLGLLIVTCISVLGLRSIQKDYAIFLDGPYLTKDYAYEMKVKKEIQKQYFFRALMVDDPTVTQKYIDIAMGMGAEIGAVAGQLMEHYKADASVMAEMQKSGADVGAARDKLLACVEAGDMAGAKRVAEEEYYPIALAGDKQLDDIIIEATAQGDAYTQDIAKAQNYSNIITVTTMIVIAIFTVLSVRRILSSIVPRIKRLEEASRQMTQGNMDVILPESGKDEIGQLAQNFRQMNDTLTHIIQDVRQVLFAMSKGDFRCQVEDRSRYVGEHIHILDAMDNIQKVLSDTLGQIAKTADEVNEGAESASAATVSLSAGASQQASTIAELSSTVESVSAQIQESNTYAQHANALSIQAEEHIHSGQGQMQEMRHAMGDIEQKSKEIGKIIKTIDDIAFQTNILALNAAVEAARAGAAGKGFAVVADEVRNLAQKSAEAARGTTELIESTMQAVAVGTGIAEKTVQSLTRIVESSEESLESIAKITQASEEQAKGMTEILSAVEEISAVVESNSTTAEHSAQASQELKHQAALLDKLVTHFQLLERK